MFHANLLWQDPDMVNIDTMIKGLDTRKKIYIMNVTRGDQSLTCSNI